MSSEGHSTAQGAGQPGGGAACYVAFIQMPRSLMPVAYLGRQINK